MTSSLRVILTSFYGGSVSGKPQKSSIIFGRMLLSFIRVIRFVLYIVLYELNSTYCTLLMTRKSVFLIVVREMGGLGWRIRKNGLFYRLEMFKAEKH